MIPVSVDRNEGKGFAMSRQFLRPSPPPLVAIELGRGWPEDPGRDIFVVSTNPGWARLSGQSGKRRDSVKAGVFILVSF